jgi:hypothetical protein
MMIKSSSHYSHGAARTRRETVFALVPHPHHPKILLRVKLTSVEIFFRFCPQA